MIVFLLLMLTGNAPALAGPCFSVCKDGRTYAYRGDSRPPEVVFREGFLARGSDFDMRRHLSGGSLHDGFVSTTRSQSVAIYYAAQRALDTEQRHGYLYEIEVPAEQAGDARFWRDIPAEYPNEPSVRANQEIARVGSIPPSLIRRATPVAADAHGVGTVDVNYRWRTNPEWNRRNPDMPVPVMLGGFADPEAAGPTRLQSCRQLTGAAMAADLHRRRREARAPGVAWCASHPDAGIRQWPPCEDTRARLCKVLLYF